MKIFQIQRGTTLIELILYLAISSGVMLGIGMTTMAVLEQKEKARSLSDARYAAAVISERFRSDVREAARVEIPITNNEASTTLRLRTLDSLNDPIVYTSDGDSLYRSHGNATSSKIHPIGVAVRDLRFILVLPDSGPPSVLLRGDVVVGNKEMNAVYRATIPLTITATLRAHQP